MALSFKATLTSADWDGRVGGWKCSALTLPGAAVDKLFADGYQVDPRHFRIDGDFIVWADSKRPSEVLAQIVLPRMLADKELLERQKFQSERLWKWVSGLGAAAAFLISTFVVPYIKAKWNSTPNLEVIKVQGRSEQHISYNPRYLSRGAESIDSCKTRAINSVVLKRGGSLVRQGTEWVEMQLHDVSVQVICDAVESDFFLASVTGPLAKSRRSDITLGLTIVAGPDLDKLHDLNQLLISEIFPAQ